MLDLMTWDHCWQIVVSRMFPGSYSPAHTSDRPFDTLGKSEDGRNSVPRMSSGNGDGRCASS